MKSKPPKNRFKKSNFKLGIVTPAKNLVDIFKSFYSTQ